MGWTVAIAVLAALIGYGLGWNHAHYTVAAECDRLGTFYVGRRTYRCVRVDAGQSGGD